MIFSYNGVSIGIRRLSFTQQLSKGYLTMFHPFHFTNMVFTYSASAYNCTIDGYSGFSGTLDYGMSFNALEFNSNGMTFTGGTASLRSKRSIQPNLRCTCQATDCTIPFLSTPLAKHLATATQPKATTQQ